MTSNLKSLLPPKLPEKSRSLVLQYALFRWENAVVLAIALLLSVFGPFDPQLDAIVWPIFGLLGMGAITLSSLTNPKSNAELLLKVFQAQFDLGRIKLAELRQEVQQALEYQRRIEAQVRHRGGDASVLWDRPEDAANQIEDWITNVYQLARRVDAYRRDSLLKQELDSVPKQLESLRARRQREANPVFQREIEQVIESKQKQLRAMEALDTRMKQAEFQLEQSLAALATVDSQVQLIDTHAADRGRSERLRSDIKEQVDRLNDLVVSINEVYEIPTPAGGGGLKVA